MPITGIEIGILTIGATGVAISLSIAASINLSFPERIQNFVNQRKHARRKDNFRNYLLVSSRSAPMSFAGICSYLSNNRVLECNREGRQYVQINLQGQPSNFNIPETDADVYLENDRGQMVFNIYGDQHEGPASGFRIYWDTDDIYNYYVENIQRPFQQQHSSSSRAKAEPKEKSDEYEIIAGVAEASESDLLCS
jgi:hypothetical protein